MVLVFNCPFFRSPLYLLGRFSLSSKFDLYLLFTVFTAAGFRSLPRNTKVFSVTRNQRKNTGKTPTPFEDNLKILCSRTLIHWIVFSHFSFIAFSYVKPQFLWSIPNPMLNECCDCVLCSILKLGFPNNNAIHTCSNTWNYVLFEMPV